MKFGSRFIGAAAVLACVLTSGTAQAGYVPFFHSNQNMSTVVQGQFGYMFNNLTTHTNNGFLFGNAQSNGLLAAHTTLEFTYNIPALLIGTTRMFGSYTVGSTTYQFSSDSNGGNNFAPLIIASADLTGSIGHTFLTNLTNSAVSFTTTLAGLLSSRSGGYLISYNASVAAVPLPASLQMLGLALVGMFAFARSKKKTPLAA